jgi:DNA helicase-2/ATP-dependent DNA helicase PcrA
MNTMLEATSWAKSLEVDIPFIKVVGAGGTGKTLGLVQRARFLVSQGIPAREVVLLCSTRAGADRAHELMRDAFGEADAAVQVTTVQRFAVEFLAHPEIKEVTGRSPRLLADFEERLLMEDMKVCGLKPKRLREMLKFFYKELSELGDERDTFICDSEESEVYSALTENLRFLQAMLPQELSNVAYKAARDNEKLCAPFKKAFVLVDDFQNLNLASQKFVEEMATRGLVVAGCLNEEVPTLEPYPHPQGFASFEQTHESEVVRLAISIRCPQQVVSMANSLVVEGGLAANEIALGGTGDTADVQLVKWTYPNDEFMGIARYIKHRLESNAPRVHAHDIFVAVPNAVWGKALAKVLRANDIKADVVTSHYALQGDPRTLEKCLDLQAYTRLNLAANPHDVVAWRSWCGLGDYLTNSNKWFHLEKYAQTANIGILEALDRAASLAEEELFPGAASLVERYRAGLAFIARSKDKLGFALLNDCAPVRGEEPPQGFMNLLEPVGGGETAAELFERAQGRLEARFADTDAVRIGLLEMSCGLSFDTVIFMGAVEGFYPARHTIGVELDDERIEEIRRAERRNWYAAMTKTQHAFIVSTVQKDESNTAAALGMYAHRIRMEDGTSMAILAPTPYLDEMGEETPGFVQALRD